MGASVCAVTASCCGSLWGSAPTDPSAATSRAARLSSSPCGGSRATCRYYASPSWVAVVGLALTREIVDAHNCPIALAQGEAGGLAVTITLPQ